MAALPATLVLFLYFTLSSGYTLLRDDDNEIIWPIEYHFKGEKIDFITTQKDTFEIWYSAQLNRSRIDGNDGTVKRWYYGDTGYLYEKSPITNAKLVVEEICVGWETSSGTQDYLPDTSDFTYTGESMTLYDKVVDIWVETGESGPKRTWETTLYVFKTDSGIDLPVQEVRKEYNYDIGQLTGHTVKNYFEFRDTITEEELTVDNEDECNVRRRGEDFHGAIKSLHPDWPVELDLAFDHYTSHHNKIYEDEEHHMRKKIFEKNWRMIEEHNRKNLGYRLELNAFADKTEEELGYLSGTDFSRHEYPEMMPFPHNLEEIDDLVKELPENFDLRMEGSVTPVKHQGECGSCWAFCTTAAVEGALARVNGDRLLDLSEQSLVDCAWGFQSHGCSGGMMAGAMQYVTTYGIPTELEYGVYTASDGYCKMQNMSTVYNIRGFSQVTPRNPNALKVALFKYGPVTVGIRVSFKFVYYSSGLFYDTEWLHKVGFQNNCVNSSLRSNMAALSATLVLFLYFTFSSGYTLLRDDDNEIIWPIEYHFKGEKIDFITTQKSSFEIWYSAELNRSRIDGNDGTVRKWYCGDTGYIYEKFPITDEKLINREECFRWETESEPEDFLPDASEFTYTGQSITLYDKVVDIWTKTDEYGKKAKETTLYVFKMDSGIDLPVQEVIKTYNYDIGQLSEHTITNYFEFRETVTEEELTVDNEEDCREKRLGMDFHKDIKLLHPDLPSHLDLAFDLYTDHHNKFYQGQEHQMRKKIFEKNWRMIEEHNRKNLGYRLELNAFSDKTEEELGYLSGTYFSSDDYPEMVPFPHTLEEIDDLVKELPENFDLRMEGSVTPVKNQAECGSCWAFCTTAAVEGALARVNGDRLLDLSEQSLVDCAWGFEASGCEGGYMAGAMKYVTTYGISTEEDYGVYTATDGYCKMQNMSTVYNIRGFSQVTPRNPNALKVALFKYGPVTVGIRISFNFMHYSSGVFYDTVCGRGGGGHCVTAVGYGVREDGEEYWIIKNSWGETWGEDGYVLMSTRDNNCLILDYAHYPIV